MNHPYLTVVSVWLKWLPSLAVPPMIPPSTFHTLLKSFNASQVHSSFERTAFSCSICLENRKGKGCIQMPSCSCVLCDDPFLYEAGAHLGPPSRTSCLKSCWSLAIEEGTLENVSCPSISCVKSRVVRDPRAALATDIAQNPPSSIDVRPDLVQIVVGKDLRQRWEQLKERRKAEAGES